jgi:hypothetical protein
MYKREITYEDFADEPQTHTKTFYFNFSKREVMEFRVSHRDLLEIDVPEGSGLNDVVKALAKAETEEKLVNLIKYLILYSYGIRSDDNQKFSKSDDIRKEFADDNAYNQLWDELSTNEGKASEFIMGIFPKDMSAEMQKMSDTAKSMGISPKDLSEEKSIAKPVTEVPLPPPLPPSN